MFALKQIVLLSTFSALLVQAAPFAKRALLTGEGNGSIHDYSVLSGDAITGACGYAGSTVGGGAVLTHVMALEGQWSKWSLDQERDVQRLHGSDL